MLSRHNAAGSCRCCRVIASSEQRQNYLRERVGSKKEFSHRYLTCTDQTLAFPAAEVNKDNILILDLNEARPVRRI